MWRAGRARLVGAGLALPFAVLQMDPGRASPAPTWDCDSVAVPAGTAGPTAPSLRAGYRLLDVIAVALSFTNTTVMLLFPSFQTSVLEERDIPGSAAAELAVSSP